MNHGDLRFAAALWSAAGIVRNAAQDSLKGFGAEQDHFV